MSVPLQIYNGTDRCGKPKIIILLLFSLLSFIYLIFSLPSQNLSLSLSQFPNLFFLFSQSDASKKKAAAAAKRGEKEAATLSKSVAAAAVSDSQNGADLISDF